MKRLLLGGASLAAIGALVAGCSLTATEPVQEVAASVPASSAPAQPSASPSTSSTDRATVATLLPPPLDVPVTASASTPMTRVANADASGWYAVLQTPAGDGDALVTALGTQLAQAGYQVETSPGHVHAVKKQKIKVKAASPMVTTGTPAPVATSASPAPAPTGESSSAPVPAPAAPTMPSLPMFNPAPTQFSTLTITPPKSGWVPVSWVEIRRLRVSAPSTAPQPASDYVSVVVVNATDTGATPSPSPSR